MNSIPEEYDDDCIFAGYLPRCDKWLPSDETVVHGGGDAEMNILMI